MARTTAVAEPLSTLVPRKQRFFISTAGRSGSGSGESNFSTGNDSPVNAPWMTNRSLAETSRTSPGIMSPAASLTTSPGTTWLTGTSVGRPSRRTVAVTLIIALSFAAAASARASCTKRRTRPRTTINIITVPARASPVAKEIVARMVSRITNGLAIACPSSRSRRNFSSCPTILGPNSASRDSASWEVRPSARVSSCA